MGLIGKRVSDLGHLAQRVTQVEPVDPSAMGTSLVIGELTDREVRHDGSGSASGDETREETRQRSLMAHKTQNNDNDGRFEIEQRIPGILYDVSQLAGKTSYE